MYVELRLLDRDAVIAPPPTPPAEKYVDYVQLPNYVSLSMSSVLSDVGFLEFEYPADLAIEAGLGLQSWVAAVVGSDEEDSKIYEPTSVDWFIIENTSVSRAVDGETVAQFQGRSWMSRLEDACAMPYAYDPDIAPPQKYLPGQTPPQPPAENQDWLLWEGYGTDAMYDNQTAGSILWDILDKAYRRGTLAVEYSPTAASPNGVLVYELEAWFNGYVDSFGYQPSTEDVLVARAASSSSPTPQDVTTNDLKVIDTIVAVDGDIILLKDQAAGNPSQNGLWVMRKGGPWPQHWSHTQPAGFPDGQKVFVRQGEPLTGNGGKLFEAEWVSGKLTFKEETTAMVGKWRRTWTGSWPAESKIFDVMRELVEGGMIESRVRVPSADPTVPYHPPRLEVWDYDNLTDLMPTDPPNPVVFRPGQNMKDHEESTDSREILNRVFVLGDKSRQLFQIDQISEEKPVDQKVILGRIREELAVFDEVSEEAALKALALARLQILFYPKVQESAGIAPSVYLPWSDYLVGDWVLLDIGQGNTATPLDPPVEEGDTLAALERYYDDRLKDTDLNYDSYTRKNFGSLYPVRVREISLRVSENGEVEVAVTLNDIIYEQNIRTQRIINSILNSQGAVVGAGSTVDTTGPPQLQWRTSSTKSGVGPDGIPRSSITVQWVKSPDSAKTVQYLLRMRSAEPSEELGQVIQIAPTKDEYSTPFNLVPGDIFGFVIQAIDAAGNISAMSEELLVRAAYDLDPPPKPSTPSASIIRPASKDSNVNWVGVKWDGLDENQDPIASSPGKPGVADFDQVYVYLGQDPAFDPTDEPSRDYLLAAGTAIVYETGAGEWYAKLVAVDVSGNASPPSDPSLPVTLVPGVP